MARTTTAAAARIAAPTAADAEPVGIELGGVALALGGLLLAGAVATYGPGDAEGAFRNVAGSLGRSVAGPLLRALGLGAWAWPLFALAWAVVMIRGRRPTAWGRKLLLLPVLAALVAVAASLLLGHATPPGLERVGPGGYLGVAFGTSLYAVLGKAAGLVVVVALLGLLPYVADVPTKRLLLRAAGALGLLDRPGRGVEAGAGAAAPRRGRRRAAGVPDEPEAGADGAGDEGDDSLGDPADPEVLDEADAASAGAGEDEDEDGEEEDREDPLPEPVLPRFRRRTLAPPPPVRRSDGTPYVFPPTDLLETGVQHDAEVVREEVQANARVLGETLASFGVEARVVASQRGPVITFYEIAVGTGVRLNRITALSDDLAIALKAPSVRIVAPIPGKSTVGVEVPNLTRDTVVLRDLLEEVPGTDRRRMPIHLGRDAAGRPLVEDLTTMPHLLVAGATGSGKSVCINAALLSLLFTRTPEDVRLILVDPKQVELSFYEGVPHLLTPVVTDMRRAAGILEWAVERMEERYGFFVTAGVRNIGGYNALPPEKFASLRERHELDERSLPDHLPFIVIVVDELADLMMTNGKEVELAITRLAQKSRAVGIHLILATQRPSTNVITGLIKANMPTRIAFHVSSKIDSRVILDANGADKLLGMGDMLLMHAKSLHLKRAQGTLVTDAEVRRVIDFLKEHGPEPEYHDLLGERRTGLGDPMQEDDLYNDAVRAVLATRLGSASMLQRRLAVGYTRASRLVDMMAERGVVGPHVGSKAREVMLTLEEWEARQAQGQGDGSGSPGPEDEGYCPDESWE